MEEPVQERSGRAGLVGGAHLAEDLSLAGDERVEPRGDAEQMQRRGVIAQPVERRLDLGLERDERIDRGALGGLPVLRRDIELGAVARREADGLAERAGERRRMGPVERDALAELYGRAVMRCAD